MTNDSRPWTEGPWGTWEHPDNNHPDWRLILGGDDSTLGEAYTEANAHLIAQAPALYEALEPFVKAFQAGKHHDIDAQHYIAACEALAAANPQGQGGDSNGN